MDYDPNDQNLNLYFDVDELYELLHEGDSGEGVNGGGDASKMVPNEMNNDVLMKARLKGEGHAKNYVKRKRYAKGSIEHAQMMELRKIKNRETAASAFAQKKAYLEQLELTVKEFKKKNTHLNNLLRVGISTLNSGGAQKQLRRTVSGPL